MLDEPNKKWNKGYNIRHRSATQITFCLLTVICIFDRILPVCQMYTYLYLEVTSQSGCCILSLGSGWSTVFLFFGWFECRLRIIVILQNEIPIWCKYFCRHLSFGTVVLEEMICLKAATMLKSNRQTKTLSNNNRKTEYKRWNSLWYWCS